MEILRAVKLVEDIPVKETIDFIADDFGILSLNYNKEDNYCSILFFIIQKSTEEILYLNTWIKIDQSDIEFIDNYPFNVKNILKDEQKIKYYIDHTKDITNITEKIYTCDMYMIEEKSKPYFFAKAKRKDENGAAYDLNIHFNRDIYIKFNIFMRLFINHNNTADFIFENNKYKNIKFSTVNHIKLDGTATEENLEYTLSHYTCGNGPELYKFTTFSKKIMNRKLINPMGIIPFSNFYSKDFIISNAFYEPENDCLYVIYEEETGIDKDHKKVKILRFYKEFYERTDLIDNKKIYEKEINKNEYE